MSSSPDRSVNSSSEQSAEPSVYQFSDYNYSLNRVGVFFFQGTPCRLCPRVPVSDRLSSVYSMVLLMYLKADLWNSYSIWMRCFVNITKEKVFFGVSDRPPSPHNR